MLTALSIDAQLDAIGVKYQGLRKWNRTEAMIRTATATAIAISPPATQRQFQLIE
jgi:hypothetical protein